MGDSGRVIVRQVGDNIEIRYLDVPLFDRVSADKALFDVASQYFNLALQAIAGHVSDAAPVGVTGNLAQSFTASPATVMGGIELLGQNIGDLNGRVFSSLPYAIVMDQGRGPGKKMPPVDAIALWAQRVLKISADEAQDAAWAIALSIAKKGIEPRNFTAQGMANALPQVEGVFEIMAIAMANALVSAKGGGRGGVSSPGGGGLV